ncbi:MAG: hypothetical protein DRN53_08495, partial [Thermoprotei archaeon]
ILGRETKIRSLEALCKSLKGTVVDEEALREVFTKDVELERIFLLFDELKRKRIRVLFVKSDPEKGRYSPLASFIIFEQYGYGLLRSGVPPKILVNTVKRRLLEKKLVSICLHCLWHGEFRVYEIDEGFKCPKCSSRVLGFTYPSIAGDVLRCLAKLRKKKKLNSDEAKLVRDLRLSSSLFLSYGRYALITLAGIGIGPTTAVRILERSLNEDSLITSIIEAERTYLRTRMYWN